MQDNIALFAKTSAKSFLKWLLIFLPGIVFCIVCVVWGFVLLLQTDVSSPAAAHTGGFGALIVLGMLCLANPAVAGMIFCSLFVFPFIYYSLASKKAMIFAVKSLWQNKIQSWFNTKISNYLVKLEAKDSSVIKKVDNFATVKIKLLHAIKEDAQINKFQKKILGFIINRVDDSAVLADQDDDSKFSDMLLLKINEMMNALTTPSNTLFYVALGVQLVLLILALKMNTFG